MALITEAAIPGTWSSCKNLPGWVARETSYFSPQVREIKDPLETLSPTRVQCQHLRVVESLTAKLLAPCVCLSWCFSAGVAWGPGAVPLPSPFLPPYFLLRLSLHHSVWSWWWNKCAWRGSVLEFGVFFHVHTHTHTNLNYNPFCI